jgi:hypothetical protein
LVAALDGVKFIDLIQEIYCYCFIIFWRFFFQVRYGRGLAFLVRAQLEIGSGFVISLGACGSTCFTFVLLFLSQMNDTSDC